MQIEKAELDAINAELKERLAPALTGTEIGFHGLRPTAYSINGRFYYEARVYFSQEGNASYDAEKLHAALAGNRAAALAQIAGDVANVVEKIRRDIGRSSVGDLPPKSGFVHQPTNPSTTIGGSNV